MRNHPELYRTRNRTYGDTYRNCRVFTLALNRRVWVLGDWRCYRIQDTQLPHSFCNSDF